MEPGAFAFRGNFAFVGKFPTSCLLSRGESYWGPSTNSRLCFFRKYINYMDLREA